MDKIEKMDKLLIQKRFEGSWNSYDQEAVIQDGIALHLLELGSCYFQKGSYGQVLELGCGSGFFTRRLCSAFDIDRLYLNDLCSNLESILRQKLNRSFQFIAGDAECLTFPRNMDLLVSASALQWFDDAPGFVRNNACLLKEGGGALFSTFAPGNLKEIKELTGMSLDYKPKEAWIKALKDIYDILYIEEMSMEQIFSDPMQVLRHMKKTGVNGTGNFVWTRERLEDFSKVYRQQYSVEGGVKLTYRPLYIVLRKKRGYNGKSFR